MWAHCRKTAFVWAALVSCAACAETGQTQRFEEHDQWASLEVCTMDECIGRAVTTDTSAEVAFVVDCTQSDACTPMMIIELTAPLQRSWQQQRKDVVSGKVRIDRGRTISTRIEREVDSDDETLFFSFDASVSNAAFIEDLKRGRTLWVRVFVDSDTYTLNFDLKGAKQALSRAQLLADELNKKPNTHQNTRQIKPSDDAIAL